MVRKPRLFTSTPPTSTSTACCSGWARRAASTALPPRATPAAPADPLLYIGSNVNFECLDDVEAPGPRSRAAIMVVGARAPELYGRLRSAPSRGWMLVGWMAKTDFYARRCRDDLSNHGYGYGAVLAGACYACDIKGTYEECRHGDSTNTYPDASDAYAGAPQECVFHDSRAVRLSATAYDNHAGALRCRYNNNRIYSMAANATGSSAGMFCGQDRGIESEWDGMHSNNFPGGLYFQPQPPPAGATRFIDANGKQLRQYVNKYRRIHCTAGDAEEKVIGGIPAFASAGGPNSKWMKIELTASTFRGMDPVFSAIFPDIEITYTKMTDCNSFRTGGNKVKITHSIIENTSTTPKEGIRVHQRGLPRGGAGAFRRRLRSFAAALRLDLGRGSDAYGGWHHTCAPLRPARTAAQHGRGQIRLSDAGGDRLAGQLPE